MDNADQVLTTVWDYCLRRRIAFKFLRGLDALLPANAKYAHRGASGKFVTIYPADEAPLSESFPVPAAFLDEAVRVITGDSQTRAGDRPNRLAQLDPDRRINVTNVVKKIISDHLH